MPTNKPRVLFLSHGGGPLPLLGDEGHRAMVDNLKFIAAKIAKPSAIIVISAHWQESVVTITGGDNPELIYDYSGFPPESYQIKYPCPGEPELADKVLKLLGDSGVTARIDRQRGFDHGVFVPLTIMYPAADIPCIEISLANSMDPSDHLKIGAAIANIAHDSLLIIGSGFSFHNMQAFFSAPTKDDRLKNEAFEQWLIDTCANSELDEPQRRLRLENWQQAPFARYCHPTAEHLLPLHVCYGVAGSRCSEYFELNILNKKSSVYLW